MKTIKRSVFLILLSIMAGFSFAQDAQTLMLKLEVKENQYQLLDAWVLPRAYPASATIEQASGGAIKWEILAEDESVLVSGIIPDPQLIRAHSENHGELALDNTRLERTKVIIRVPYSKAMHHLVIERTPIIPLPEINTGKQKPTKADKHSFIIDPRAP